MKAATPNDGSKNPAEKTIFSKIIAGEIPSHTIAKDANYYAFLDTSPLKKGHVLVIPKEQVDYLFDLEDETLAGLMIFAKKVAKAMQLVIKCERIAVAVIGLEVPHAHVHLIPVNKVSDINFSNTRLILEPEEYKQIATDIAKHIK